MSIQYATKQIIESIWTLAFKVVDGKAEVISYDRTNPIGYEQVKTLPTATIVEDDERIVREIQIQSPDSEENTVFEVSNPQFIFSYSK